MDELADLLDSGDWFRARVDVETGELWRCQLRWVAEDNRERTVIARGDSAQSAAAAAVAMYRAVSP